jgi:hypothetical protein
MQEIKITKEQAEALQDFITDHRNACHMALYDEEDVVGSWQSYDVYDGCDICETREHLMATFDWLKTRGIVDIYVE